MTGLQETETMKEVKFRRCGNTWMYCDGDCDNCPTAKATVSTTSTLSEYPLYTDRTDLVIDTPATGTAN